ncbi:MAG TPA: excinuclease ABC subunit UvrA [Acidobacteriota bacterium]|nr:excinuclease ABC subunit UvrA [Acidobacteriota bacterium]HNT17520.1 excinuclease ABC subunit UvrA [Acidobacteriota bacterium]
MDKIVIKGAKEHNLKNIDLILPKNKLIVITGLSGSGKSSLAFDTLYAEGQRRYVESLSAYARQFLDLMQKPDVETIEGLSPAISIEQRSSAHNPRSTVGTVTEIYDYARLLYARIGTPYCPDCGKPIRSETPQEIVDKILKFPEGEKILVMAPVVRGRKGEYRKLFEELQREGFVRARVDGTVQELRDGVKDLARYKAHTIDVVIDRLVMKSGMEGRLTESVELALKRGEGLVVIHTLGDEKDHLFSEKLSCSKCGTTIPEMEPRLFSFNSPHGACPECTGLGIKLEIDPSKIIPKPTLSLTEGAVAPWESEYSSWYKELLEGVAKEYGFSMKTPFHKLSEEARNIVLNGTNGRKVNINIEKEDAKYNFNHVFEGVIPNLWRRYRETKSDYVRQEIEGYMSSFPCPACQGLRLKKEALSVKIAGMSIAQFTDLSVDAALAANEGLTLTRQQEEVARQILKETRSRLKFLQNVGLGYLTLSRSATTLSGGESQRIRLATQVGSQLTGVLYVLDEPSIGLHPRDNKRLLDTLVSMRDLGNTIVVVEHDEATMRNADHIVDLGPGAGVHGGEVVAQGTVEEICASSRSLTGDYLSGRKKINTPAKRRQPKGFFKIVGAEEHNLKKIDVEVPVGTLTVVTGVSGSGKSTLVHDILYKGLARRVYHAVERPGKHRDIVNWQVIDKIIEIDQSPIGRTPRSNPSTYTGLFTHIRQIFAEVPEARARGYTPGRFSFNVKGGRCEACEGDGVIRIEMHFLPDVYVTCETCRGDRYNRDTLEIRFKGKTIAEVLEMTVEEALTFFEAIPIIHRKLKLLNEVGLGYIRLGQRATTLSGGEAQRIKLAKELSRSPRGNTLYVLDEPTTGLHFEDIRHLIKVLNRLVDHGSTVIVIEHNLDVVKCADHIIDLGPEGGEDGGTIVASGTPEEVAACEKSYTGKFLQKILRRADDEDASGTLQNQNGGVDKAGKRPGAGKASQRSRLQPFPGAR